MDEAQFLEWRKEHFPEECFLEQIQELIADEMVFAPINYIHTSNYFWKKLVSFCLDQIE